MTTSVAATRLVGPAIMTPDDWPPFGAEGLGKPLVSVSAGDGLTAALHRQNETGPIWLLTEEDDVEGGGASAAATCEGPASCLVGDSLVIGDVMLSPRNVVTVGLPGRIQHPTASAEGVWLTVFERVALPVNVIVREFDGAGGLISTLELDFPADRPITLRSMLWRARTWGRRHRTGQMPTRTTTYP